ncbi:hypothetical protein GTO10_07000 [Candidatus Saccharibacteria bacterium]|nr:hypothetical protein [Candidatus Saccharibacteria bacterium]
MKKILPVLTSILSLSLVLLGSTLFAQTLSWREEDVIFSDTTVHNVEVISLPDGRYRMYFHQGTQMKSAVSADGRAFQVEDGVRLTGSMPSLVKLPDGSWRMYFQTIESGRGAIKSATSQDGLNWTAESGTRLTPGGQHDPDNVVHPSVVTLPQGGWRMYYDGEIRRTEQEFTWRVLSATSSDGLIWTKDAGIRINVDEEPLEADSVWNAHAIYEEEEGVFRLYFAVQTPNENFSDGIYSATSTDGLVFSDPVAELTPEEESGQFGTGGQLGSYQDPFVLDFPEGRRMYYWVNGGGIYSALQVEDQEAATDQENQAKTMINRLLEKAGLGGLKISIPQNIELFLIPSILLVAGGTILFFLLKARRKKEL